MTEPNAVDLESFSLINPIHPEILDTITNARPRWPRDPLYILRSQLETTSGLLDFPDGKYFEGPSIIKPLLGNFLTDIQSDIINLSNSVFREMLFNKLVHLITHKSFSGYDQGMSTNWELMDDNTCLDDTTGYQAIFKLNLWWHEDSSARFEWMRLTVIHNPDAKNATARIEELAADLKTVISARESILDKYSDLDEWVKKNI